MTQTIAAQLWTVRSLCGDPKSLAAALAALRSIGYRFVEVAATGAIPASEVRRIMEGAGVAGCCAHADSQQILADPASVAATVHALGCDAVAYPYPRGQDLSTSAGVDRLCRQLMNAASVFQAEGITFSYHHHSIELQRLDGRTVLETILERTDPRLLQVELDTYWLQAGGVDPARWIQRCRGRAPFLHLKDYGVDSTGAPRFREIGAGNLDWSGILSAAQAAGTRWLIVEQDDHWTDGDPLGSLRSSWEGLRRIRGT